VYKVRDRKHLQSQKVTTPLLSIVPHRCGEGAIVSSQGASACMCDSGFYGTEGVEDRCVRCSVGDGQHSGDITINAQGQCVSSYGYVYMEYCVEWGPAPGKVSGTAPCAG
jgi:hypothetical protein